MSSEPPAPIRFVDLVRQQEILRDRIDAALARTLEHGQYVMGPEVGELEAALAAHTGAKHAVATSSGTDSLALVLMAKTVRPGQAIFCPAFTFVATAEVVAWLGATVFFVDVLEDTFNMDPASLERAVEEARRTGLEPAGIIPVDLFGLPADYAAIEPIAEREGLWVLSDAAQSFGSRHHERHAGTLGDAAATSFFPAKPLGCYGDAGAVFTDDDDLADTVRSLLFHGKGENQYDNVRVGMTGRMDSIQAGILLAKLSIFDEEIAARNAVAARYSEALSGVVATPGVPEGLHPVWAQYTVRAPEGRRETIVNHLRESGVPVAIYYPTPLNRQTAYRDYPVVGNGVPVSERLCQSVFSLPMHPYLDEETQAYIVEKLIEAAKA
ncbi:DegT/DnrJ/EryC1/StrS family aminotransferase [Pararhizobium mangrovi]|uniref:DegT/DnrJ/EryC1/StrS family aminotransferase n=1 Tax=Pararhizobium mangrovi TaxID=2590452 RepID=A0A506UCH4_9HYPH|nr:DegT/DnrJ/EryC1/StrS family aminotransferase [Pararhizobium mangrovi]TPW30654.1 DegT/DnrJ/EryC1/StrS family aminotransferase [Pararhizobium mangrovi]